eukprot:6045450-Amphidinium_carterae.1
MHSITRPLLQVRIWKTLSAKRMQTELRQYSSYTTMMECLSPGGNLTQKCTVGFWLKQHDAAYNSTGRAPALVASVSASTMASLVLKSNPPGAALRAFYLSNSSDPTWIKHRCVQQPEP